MLTQVGFEPGTSQLLQIVTERSRVRNPVRANYFFICPKNCHFFLLCTVFMMIFFAPGYWVMGGLQNCVSILIEWNQRLLITYSLRWEESFTLADFEELFNLAKRDEEGERTVLAPQNEMPQDLPQQLEISFGDEWCSLVFHRKNASFSIETSEASWSKDCFLKEFGVLKHFILRKSGKIDLIEKCFDKRHLPIFPFFCGRWRFMMKLSLLFDSSSLAKLLLESGSCKSDFRLRLWDARRPSILLM